MPQSSERYESQPGKERALLTVATAVGALLVAAVVGSAIHEPWSDISEKFEQLNSTTSVEEPNS